MSHRSALIVASLIFGLSAGAARADFQIRASITSINGVAVAGGTFTDTYGNVLSLGPAYSATGTVLFAPSVGFTASTATANFHKGTDSVVSTIVVTNLAGGGSLTFTETQNFIFATSSSGNYLALDPNGTLTNNSGTPSIFGPFVLGNVAFRVTNFGSLVGLTNTPDVSQGNLYAAYQIVPEPPSLALVALAAVVGLAAARVRRAHQGRGVGDS